MDRQVAKKLNQLNTQFYAKVAPSFSATRQAPWPGWRRCLENVRECSRVLDVACGNLRFARFLADDRLSADDCARVDYVGVDNNAELPKDAPEFNFNSFQVKNIDIICSLLNDIDDKIIEITPSTFDLVVCFGFFHHIPTTELRQRFLRDLIGFLKPGGVCCLSLWCFARDRRLADKADRTTQEALAALDLKQSDLDPGDYLLGWQDQPDVWRYCHSFSATEIDSLVDVAAPHAKLLDRFSCDGRTGALNEYLVFNRL